jgi:hypothetical protein
MINARLSIWIIITLCLFFTTGLAQDTYEATFTLVVDGSSLYLDLYLRTATGTSAKLGDATLTFAFNSTALLMVGKDAASDGRWDNGSSADYTNLGVTNASPIASFDIVKSSAGSGLDIPTVATRVGRIVFTILDPNASPGIVWMPEPLSVAYDWDGNPLLVDLVNPLDVPLPVQLVSFVGTLEMGSNVVSLKWSTVSEINNYGFTVQRRAVGDADFVDLQNSFIPGHGTTLQPQSYSFTDNTIRAAGDYEYRLKQTDLDGTVHYSDPVKVIVTVTDVAEAAPMVFQLLQNYPNPFNPSTQIRFSVGSSERAQLSVYNMLGQQVATLFDEVAEAGRYYAVRFDAAGLSSGMYFYKLQSGARSEMKKLLLMK